MASETRPLVGADLPPEPEIASASIPDEPGISGAETPDEPELTGAHVVAPQIVSAFDGS